MNRRRNRHWRIAALLALALGTTVLAGCTSAEKKEGGMELPEVWGYVAGERFAQLEVVDQEVDADTLVVKRVLTPADAWIVVHVDDDGMPGDRVGLKHISKGESLDVEVPLKDATEKVIVAVHADRGEPNEFDFDMMNKMQSPDRPFFVNDKELAKAIELEGLDSKSEEAQGSVEATGEPSMVTTPTQDASGQAPPSTDDSSMDDASTDEASSAKKDEKDDSSIADSSEDSAMDEDPSSEGGSSSEDSMDEGSSSKGESSGEDEEMDESEGESNPPWALLGGFALVNAGIIAVAAILKRRSAKAKTEGSQGNA